MAHEQTVQNTFILQTRRVAWLAGTAVVLSLAIPGAASAQTTGGGAFAFPTFCYQNNAANQLTCGNNSSATGANTTAYGAGATASGDNSTAIGQAATASGTGSTATGTGATASGNQSTATGQGAIASNTGATATGNTAIASNTGATATGANATASGVQSIATGNLATASGFQATAVGATSTATQAGATALGFQAHATGLQSTALGDFSTASGSASTAVGLGAIASGATSTAIGPNSTAAFTNSAAFGSGATATAANQMAFGTAANTYQMTGITSAASLAAQTGPSSFVTTDAGGNLATSNFGPGTIATLQGNVAVLQQQTRLAFAGTAVAIAMGGTALPADKKFAISADYGYFNGQNAIAFMGQMRLSPNLVANAGVGTGFLPGGVGGRAGLTLAW